MLPAQAEFLSLDFKFRGLPPMGPGEVVQLDVTGLPVKGPFGLGLALPFHQPPADNGDYDIQRHRQIDRHCMRCTDGFHVIHLVMFLPGLPLPAAECDFHLCIEAGCRNTHRVHRVWDAARGPCATGFALNFAHMALARCRL